jgi:hypothetical protein
MLSPRQPEATQKSPLRSIALAPSLATSFPAPFASSV